MEHLLSHAKGTLHYQVKLPPNFPAVVRLRSGSILQPHLHPSLFVEHELDVDILDDLADWLWLAGRLDNIRPLHHQHLRGRHIVLTANETAPSVERKM